MEDTGNTGGGKYSPVRFRPVDLYEIITTNLLTTKFMMILYHEQLFFLTW